MGTGNVRLEARFLRGCSPSLDYFFTLSTPTDLILSVWPIK
jgi:hypothetical protein